MTADVASPAARGGADRSLLGLFDASRFRIVPGGEASGAGPAASWYFAHETVAVPADGAAVAGFATSTRWLHDVRRWSDSHPGRPPLEAPPLVWLGAPDVVRGARMSADGASIALREDELALALADKLPLNQSWYDSSSTSFFAAGGLMLTGTQGAAGFKARSFWPEAFTLGPETAPHRPLERDADAGKEIVRRMREDRDATAAFEAHTLWERAPARDWRGKTALGFLVSGAQGDDDEAHAGHFAIATGRVDDQGAIDHWMVNNFYSLDIESEKGILAAPVPLSCYLGDLNAGQSWYRPSWMLVALLDDERAAVRVQSALGRVFRHFWRHQLVYRHATENCTSISIDTLRVLGLDVPAMGPTSGVLAALGFPVLVLRERSLARARTAFDYVATERTRLLPALALQATADALWRLARREEPPTGRLGLELGADLAALAWLRFPQFPSSRAQGGPPVVSLDEYRARVPRDPAMRQVVVVPSREFPDALRDADLLPPLPRPSDRVVRYWMIVPLAIVAFVLILFLR